MKRLATCAPALLSALLVSSCIGSGAGVKDGGGHRPFVTCGGIDMHVYSAILSNGDTMTLDFRDQRHPGFKHNVQIGLLPPPPMQPYPNPPPPYDTECSGGGGVTLSVYAVGTDLTPPTPPPLATWILTPKDGYAFHLNDPGNGIFLGGAYGDFVMLQ